MPRSRAELVEELRNLKRREEDLGGLLGNTPATVLHEAAAFLARLGEGETEHGLLVDQVGGTVRLWPGSLNICRERAKAIEPRGEVHSVRIQRRTAYRTPWTDVEEGE